MIRIAIVLAAALCCLAAPAQAEASYRFAGDRYAWGGMGPDVVKAIRKQRHEKAKGKAKRSYRAPAHRAPITLAHGLGREVTRAFGQPAFVRGRLICAVNVGRALARGIRGTGSALARSYLHWGRSSGPTPGAVAVFSRGARARRHRAQRPARRHGDLSQSFLEPAGVDHRALPPPADRIPGGGMIDRTMFFQACGTGRFRPLARHAGVRHGRHPRRVGASAVWTDAAGSPTCSAPRSTRRRTRCSRSRRSATARAANTARPVNGHVYYGRGYVQLTWDYNYKKWATCSTSSTARPSRTRARSQGCSRGSPHHVRGHGARQVHRQEAGRLLQRFTRPIGCARARSSTELDRADIIANYAREFHAALDASAIGA
jgi:hypothetical protein